MIKYDKLLKIFKERGITSYTVKKEKIISQSTLQHIKRNQPIDGISLNFLCKYLQCQPGELLEYVPDEEADND